MAQSLRAAALAGVLLFLAAFAPAARAEIAGCACDVSKPETMLARQCALCRETEKQPPEPRFFFLKDNNPRKPNRSLALPRFHGDGAHQLGGMTRSQRAALWTAAIRHAKSLFGDEWGLALNGDHVRTQCHAHIHIGRLIRGVERDNFIVVRGPEQIPLPAGGAGLWVHPAGGGLLHVHTGEQITETVLMK